VYSSMLAETAEMHSCHNKGIEDPETKFSFSIYKHY
jgi:hypothetical protein